MTGRRLLQIATKSPLSHHCSRTFNQLQVIIGVCYGVSRRQCQMILKQHFFRRISLKKKKGLVNPSGNETLLLLHSTNMITVTSASLGSAGRQVSSQRPLGKKNKKRRIQLSNMALLQCLGNPPPPPPVPNPSYMGIPFSYYFNHLGYGYGQDQRGCPPISLGFWEWGGGGMPMQNAGMPI